MNWLLGSKFGLVSVLLSVLTDFLLNVPGLPKLTKERNLKKIKVKLNR